VCCPGEEDFSQNNAAETEGDEEDAYGSAPAPPPVPSPNGNSRAQLIGRTVSVVRVPMMLPGCSKTTTASDIANLSPVVVVHEHCRGT
jgi:hypothetical protein